MPIKPPKICAKHGCTVVTYNRYCDEHQKEYEAKRASYSVHNKMYDNARWKKARVTYLNHNPLCVECLREGRTEPATTVDHIKDHNNDWDIFFDTSNWQALCTSCHSKKTVRTKGYFGKVVKDKPVINPYPDGHMKCTY